MGPRFSSDSIRAARVLADLSQTDLAKLARVSRVTVQRIEQDPNDIRKNSYDRVIATLESRGVKLRRDQDDPKLEWLGKRTDWDGSA